MLFVYEEQTPRSAACTRGSCLLALCCVHTRELMNPGLGSEKHKMIPLKHFCLIFFFFPSDAICNFVICNDSPLRGQPIIFNPDFFVEKLRHEKPEVFTELVVSNITRLIDLPGTELAQLMGEVDLKLPGGAGPAAGFFRSLMSLKRKGRSCAYGGQWVLAADWPLLSI